MNKVEELIAMKWGVYAETLICTGKLGEGVTVAQAYVSYSITREEAIAIAAHIVKVHNESLERKEPKPAIENATFFTELLQLINRHNRENVSNTPDYMLANFICNCLVELENTVKARDYFYSAGKKDAP